MGFSSQLIPPETERGAPSRDTTLFLEKLNLDNCTFFWCGPQYRELFSHFLNSHGMSNRYFNYNYQHVTQDDPVRSQFKKTFKQVLEKNSKYITNLDNFFSKDYKLIRSIKFYAG